MKKISRRAGFALIIAAALILGLALYSVRLFNDGDDWVMLRANQSVFKDGVLDTGMVTDRNGVVLARAGNGVFAYADDASVRIACLHAVGDYAGNFGTGALSAFDDELAHYNFFDGVTTLSDGGGIVRLSIDSALNVAALNALAGRRGAVLVSNYETGEILCMVSTPAYDPNSPPELEQPAYEGVYLNRALNATYAPGSVFKLVTLAAAIENVPDIYTRSFECQGSVRVGGDTVNCTGVHGAQTIEQALANSCNCAFSELSQELGADTLEKYAKQLGFLDSLDISGIETAAGSFEKAETGTSDLSWSGIGQYNDLVAPIAVLRYVSAVAAGGTVKEPVLIKDRKGNETKLLEYSTAAKIGEMMSYNVSYSYGTWRFPELDMHAKSGTAELGDGSSHAWFAGYIDDDEHPLAFTVIIERGGGGLANAAPLANTVLQAAIK